MDEKSQQAVKIIVAQLSKTAANTPADFGTIGALAGATKRECAADGMARQFVTRLTGVKFSGSLLETWTPEETAANDLVKEIAAAAIAISGK